MERTDSRSRPGSVRLMGLNPFRQHTKTTLDIALVVGAIALTIGALVWAIAGG